MSKRNHRWTNEWMAGETCEGCNPFILLGGFIPQSRRTKWQWPGSLYLLISETVWKGHAIGHNLAITSDQLILSSLWSVEFQCRISAQISDAGAWNAWKTKPSANTFQEMVLRPVISFCQPQIKRAVWERTDVDSVECFSLSLSCTTEILIFHLY